MPTPAWRRYLTFFKPDVRRDVDDELAFHLEERTADLVASGLTPAAAQRQARAEFGDVEQVSAGLRDIDHRILTNRARTEWRSVMQDEIRHALRRLARQPAFTVPAVLTLALGIGATTAIFTVLDAVVLRPLPYANADRLVYIDSPVPGVGKDTRWWLARHEMFYFKQNARALEDLGVYHQDELTILGDGSNGAERARSADVSSTMFSVLGLRPYLGRLLSPEDNVSRHWQVVVLGYDFWRRRFGGDPNIVGKTIPVEGFPLQVVGVLQPGAHLPDQRVDVWTPAYVDPNMPAVNNHTWFGIGRLRPGYEASDLERELVPLVKRFAEVFPTAYRQRWLESSGFTVAVTPLRDWIVGDVVTRALWILLGSVALVFVVAAANVANLLLVRLEARRRELAMRLALGANRAHVAAHFLAEGLVLSLAAAALGVALAWAGLRVLIASAPDGIPRLSEVSLDWRSVSLAIALAVGIGIVFAIVPIASARVDVRTLREGSRSLTTSRRRHVVRGALVAGQVALALILLTAAGLMVKSFRNLRGVQAGFDPRNVLTMAMSLPGSRYDNDRKIGAFVEQLANQIRAMPDVQEVGFGDQVPPEMTTGCTGVVTEAASREEMKSACIVNSRVAPGYFEALGVRVSGDRPTWAQTDAGAGPAIISRALAERFWPGENPIGKGIRCCHPGKQWYRIIGVADDVRGNGFDQPVTQVIYFPIIALDSAQLEGSPRYLEVIVRSKSGNLRALSPAVKRVIASLDAQVPIANERSMQQVVAQSMVSRTFTLMLLGIASLMALVLSAIGLYGVVSYVVGQRRGEIGIRVALGAQKGEVGRMIVVQSVRMAVIGVVLGVVGALGVTRLMRSWLFEVEPSDPVTLGLVGLFLLVVAACASWIPARRAMRVDPSEALRTS
jgi:predicted permease